MLDRGDQTLLLEIARACIEAAVAGAARPELRPGDRHLERKSGVFVTLKAEGSLRGCIGLLEPTMPLWRAVAHSAVASALEDFRFPPVEPGELSGLHLDISVLSRPRPISDPREVQPGTHGLVIERGAHRGLLLPQVATELGWGREEFLRQTCRKAGLPLNAWQEGATVFVFEAQVFGESLSALYRDSWFPPEAYPGHLGDQPTAPRLPTSASPEGASSARGEAPERTRGP